MSNEAMSRRVRELLEQAVECLGSKSNPVHSPVQTPRVPSRSTTPSYLSSRPGPSRDIERNSLFNFGKKKGKGKGKAKKKVNIKAWNHDFICLAKKDMVNVPTAGDRSKLLTAGM